MASFKQRLVSFYAQYAPEKVEDDQALDDLLKKSAGKEEKLFEKLVAKYGPEPPKAAAATTAKPAAPSVVAAAAEVPAKDKKKPAAKASEKAPEAEYGSRAWWKERLARFYGKYAPEKTAQDLDAVLDKTKDDAAQLDKLFRMLEKKYGPEPEPSSDEENEDEDEDESEDEDDSEDEQQHDSFDQPKQKKKPAKTAAELQQPAAVELPSCLRQVVYCPVDGVPPEFSEFFPDTFKLALPWLAANTPSLVLASGKTALAQCQELGLESADVVAAAAAKPRSRGDASTGGGNKKKNAEGASVVLEMQSRRGKKAITSIMGLELCVDGLRLKDAAKLLGKKFATGASVKDSPQGKGEVIEIQGDFLYDLPEVLLEFYPTLDKKRLFAVDEDGKKAPAMS